MLFFADQFVRPSRDYLIMKIKNKKKYPVFPGRARDFWKRRSLVAWGLRLGAVLVVVLDLFGVPIWNLPEGAGHTTYFNNALQKLVKL